MESAKKKSNKKWVSTFSKFCTPGDRGVHHLLSPPRLPTYNGACEAGIGPTEVP